MDVSTGDTVILEIEGASIECTRTDLTENSDYFKVMFAGNFIESTKRTIALNGVDLDAVKLILKLLWDREYPMGEEQLLSVLQAACMLQFLEIKAMCVERLHAALSIHNCLTIWLTTEELDIKSIYLRAKLMAMIEFDSVSHSDYLLEMSVHELTNYLGNVYLQPSDEFQVFEIIVKWFEHSDNQSVDALLKLLHCIDFPSLTTENIDNILLSHIVLKFDHILDALKSIRQNPNNLAQSLLKSRRRNLNGGPCLLAENLNAGATDKAANPTVCLSDKYKRKTRYTVLDNQHMNYSAVYVDPNTLDLTKRVRIEPPNCTNLNGFQIVGYKTTILVFGGEYVLLGRGGWNTEVFMYDVILDKWTIKTKLPYVRRHFQSCISGKYLFVVGGTGPFRVVQENLFWYDLELDKDWSNCESLLCDGRQIKCCPFNRQLFILDLKSNCGHIFDAENSRWTLLKIRDGSTLPGYSNHLVVFAFKEKIYIKEEKLTELTVQGCELIVTNRFDLPGTSSKLDYSFKVESVLCNHLLYSLISEKRDEDSNEAIILEVFDVETRKALTTSPTSVLKFKGCLTIFGVFHDKLVETDSLVNDFPNKS